MPRDYDGYTAYVPSDPSYYGPDCTEEDAKRIVSSLTRMIEAEYDGITVQQAKEGDGPTIGPDDTVCYDIDRWIEANWGAAL